MSEQSKIEWTDSTFNPWLNCTKVGPGCDNCYAEAMMDKRMHVVQWGAGQPRKRTSAANWRKPIQWNAKKFFQCTNCGARGEGFNSVDRDGAGTVKCGACGSEAIKETRRRVFCASLADVFDNEVDPQWRADLFALIAATPNLDYLLLTKRIGNVSGMVPLPWISKPFQHGPNPNNVYPAGWPANVWLGITVVNQAEADRDIPKLLEVPARVRFLSIEPMLGPINLHPWLCKHGDVTKPEQKFGHFCDSAMGIHQVIVGGESGPQARPMHPDWARSLRDQCAAADVPFLFKQWGEWLPKYDRDRDDPDWRDSADIARWPNSQWLNLTGGQGFHGERVCRVQRVGKKAAGRLLDGLEWNGFPEPRA